MSPKKKSIVDMDKSNCYLNPPLQLEQDDPVFTCGKYRGARQSADAKKRGNPSDFSVASSKIGWGYGPYFT